MRDVDNLVSNPEDTRARLSALEERIRRQDVMLSILCAIALGAILVAARDALPARSIARAFVLMDEAGQRRAELGMATVLSNQPNAQQMRVPYLRFYDEKGRTRSEMTLGAHGSPSIALTADSLRTGVELGIEQALGAAQLRLFHNENKGLVQLSVDSQGTARILIRDAEGKVLDVK